MVSHKGQEKTGEHQHYISCLYCSLWLNKTVLSWEITKQANKGAKLFVSREGEVRVWRGCKPEGLKRRLGGGLGEAEGPTGKATVQIARHARLRPRQVCGRA